MKEMWNMDIYSGNDTDQIPLSAYVAFALMDPDLTHEREIYSYAWDSFIADFGGYLGRWSRNYKRVP